VSYLLVAGIPFPGSVKSSTEPVREIGVTETAHDGTLLKSIVATKLDKSFESVPLPLATAFAWACMARGAGECWSFDASLYSANGLGPNGTPDCALASAHPKFGTQNLSLTATTGGVSYAAALGSNWTVRFWRREDGVWRHYVVCSDGKKWRLGERDDAAVTSWLSVASGTATLTNTTGAAVEYDDLVVLPYLVPTTWPPLWAALGVAFSPLPRLHVTGDAIAEGGTRLMLGAAPASKDIKTASGWLRVLTVSLQMV
jgi:hypothetical protein